MPNNENIDITTLIIVNMKLISFKFIDYIIDVYKKCFKRSFYIDIDKDIFFGILIVLGIIYGDGSCNYKCFIYTLYTRLVTMILIYLEFLVIYIYILLIYVFTYLVL